jgi:hypothetical protein
MSSDKGLGPNQHSLWLTWASSSGNHDVGEAGHVRVGDVARLLLDGG